MHITSDYLGEWQIICRVDSQPILVGFQPEAANDVQT